MTYTEQDLKATIDTIVKSKEIINMTFYVKSIFFQVAVGDTFTDEIHYEMYKQHIELHFERREMNGSALAFFKEELPDDATFSWGKYGFAVYYRLNRAVNENCLNDVADALSSLYKQVNPVVEKYARYLLSLTDITKEIGDYYRKEKNKLPYHINVIDELHADENAHTRILVKLLMYKAGTKPVILDSFMQLISRVAGNIPVPAIEYPQIDCNKQYIDALIEEKYKYGVIIENKVHWATDQDKQIERYIDTVRSHGIPFENVWVIYLTRDGSKEVSESSLTTKTKEALGKRFVELNYRDHILPWLTDEVLPGCLVKEEWLTSALKQYVDHLEGLFGKRLSQANMNKALEQYLQKLYNINPNSPLDVLDMLKKQRHDVELLANVINNLYEKTKKEVVLPLLELTREVYQELGVSLLEINEQDTFIQFYPSGKKSHIHFEWVSVSARSLLEETVYRLDFHVEGNDIQTRKLLTEHTGLQDFLLQMDGGNEELMQNDVIVFSKNYSIPEGLPFYKLSRSAQKEFLRSVYRETFPFFGFMNELEKKSRVK